MNSDGFWCLLTGEVLERKGAMLACRRSRQQWLDESQGLASHLRTEAENEMGGQ